MKNFGILFSCFVLLSCQNKDVKVDYENNIAVQNDALLSKDTFEEESIVKTNPTVIVLPPYNQIANRGISPNVQLLLEKEMIKSDKLDLIEFSFEELSGVDYHNVYDKKYCGPIIQKFDPDIVIMSKLDFVIQTGSMPRDGWNLRIKIYNPRSDITIESKVHVDSLSPPGIEKVLMQHKMLEKEILSTIATNTMQP